MNRPQIIRVEDVLKQRYDAVYAAYVAMLNEPMTNANVQVDLATTTRQLHELAEEIVSKNLTLGEPYPPD